MNFDESATEAAFRAEVRSWLRDNAVERPDDCSPVALLTSFTAEDLPEARRVQGALRDAGLAGISWPEAYGGRGGTVVEELIFQEEASRYQLPLGIFLVGMALAGPTIIAHGTLEQQERFLAPMLAGEEVWCQLFSEPGAGSDLAGMRSRAELDGDPCNDGAARAGRAVGWQRGVGGGDEWWVVTGQKVWNSGAQYSDWGILPVRTDSSQPKHKGISYFVVDMRTPGITVRPLRQISGHSHFCEVFLDEVRIPAQQMLGGVNEGWAVTQTTLMNERMMIGHTSAEVGDPGRLIALARSCARNGGRASDDPIIRQRLVDLHIRSELLRFLQYRTLTALGEGRPPGPEGSVGKLSLGLLLRRLGDLALEIEGPGAMLANGSAGAGGGWQDMFLSAPAMRIAGGTDEIQRNIISERVLGLPREHDAARTEPFAATTPEGAP